MTVQELVAAVLEKLKVEPNVVESGTSPGDVAAYFVTKGNPDIGDDPKHSLSKEFHEFLVKSGIDPDSIFQNDCEGCYNEFSLDCSQQEDPEVIEWRNFIGYGPSDRAFHAAMDVCNNMGLNFELVTGIGSREVYRLTDPEQPFCGRVVADIAIRLVKTPQLQDLKTDLKWELDEDKSYWTKYSAVIVGEYFLYINTGNEDWALFRGKNEFMADAAEFISPQDGKPRKHNMGLMETLRSCGIHGETLKNLLTEYIDFLS